MSRRYSYPLGRTKAGPRAGDVSASAAATGKEGRRVVSGWGSPVTRPPAGSSSPAGRDGRGGGAVG
jgi:hypothetical protein